MENPLNFDLYESTELIIDNSNDNMTILLLGILISIIITSMFVKNRQANKLLNWITGTFQEDRDLYSITKMPSAEEEEESVEVVECVVCLCRVIRGEKYKILPNCNHGFHSHCIDSWLKSHSTCPLCRSSVTSISYCNITNRDIITFDVLLSNFVRVADHFRAWLVNPISPSMESGLGQNCLSFI
ncbi:hypothetical protein ACP275_09G139800 [Erythranthe tilingii]